MKNFVALIAFVLAAIIIVIFTNGCNTLPTPPDTPIIAPPNISGQILMKVTVNGQVMTITSNTTIYLPANTTVIFEGGTKDTSLHIVSWQWQLPTGNVNDKYARYSTGAPGTSSVVRVVGIDSNNRSYELTITINADWFIVGNNQIVFTSNNIESDGSVTSTIAICRERIAKIRPQAGTGYYTKGTHSDWTYSNILASDTAYGLVNKVLTTDSKGLYVKVVVRTKVGDVKFGFGKIEANTGKEIWSNFYGSSFADSTNPTLIVYNVAVTGGQVVITPLGGKVVTPPNANTQPGKVLDNADPWVVSVTPENPKLEVFVNNYKDFTSIKPFLALRNDNGQYVNTKVESAVSGFETAGSVLLDYQSLPVNRLVAFRMGLDYNHPSDFADSIMAKCKTYYNAEFKDIRFVIVSPVLMKSTGRAEYTIRPAIKGLDY